MALEKFHPLVRDWFSGRFKNPSDVQRLGWEAISENEDALLAAPTGSGKTLAAFLWAINRLATDALASPTTEQAAARTGRTSTRRRPVRPVRPVHPGQGDLFSSFPESAAGSAGKTPNTGAAEAGHETATLESPPTPGVRVLYVSPLKALGNDIEKNLRGPLDEIGALARERSLDLPTITVGVRSGDTPAYQRQLQVKKPPQILITTPESLYILLTADRSRSALASVETIILDEIHAVAEDKRGLHLALSLERLDRLVGRKVQRIGLSATQNPIEDIARLLVGNGRLKPDGTPDARIVDTGHRRQMELSIEVPESELGPIASQEMQAAVYDRIAELSAKHRSTIVFVNTRRLVERASHALSDRLGKDRVAAHHGSLSRETRLKAEQGLKSGDTPLVVATASLELGIDVGHVDLVCHIGPPRTLSTLLQRVGRSGHSLNAIPRGVLFPMTRDELLQCAAAVRAARAGLLDRIHIPTNALDILAQQLVATSCAEDVPIEELWELARRASPYSTLQRKDFDEVLEMLAEGVSTKRGRRGAHVHLDRVRGVVRGRRGARLAAITSGGAIPDTADYDVIAEPEGFLVGKVNEDFAVESLAGDIFLLGNHSWKIRRVEYSSIRVEDAGNQPPNIPFWFGESPGRSHELSRAVSDLRQELADRCHDRAAAVAWLVEECGVDRDSASQLVGYIADSLTVLGTIPTLDRIVAERFFDEAGGMQLVLHAPFGARVNRAFGLALRKRFCVSFDFELQAAATDDGIVLSLGEQHSFPLANIFSMVRSHSFEKDVTQAVLQSPMFTNRWRWNASRALALLRHSGGKKVPLPIQRMRAEDLLGAVFPDQLGCQDNRIGNIEPPDHPLVRETLNDCLHEAMDADSLRRVLQAIEEAVLGTVAVETPAPSPLSHELLGANPYAFLDDAPLEERRARAVSLRRVDPSLASGIGALDEQAVLEVREQAWPSMRSREELHDALLTLCLLPPDCGPGTATGAAIERHAIELIEVGRATWLHDNAGKVLGLVPAERVVAVRALYPESTTSPEPAFVAPPPHLLADNGDVDPEAAACEMVRGWMDSSGPTRSATLAETTGLERLAVDIALAKLESQGTVLQGSFTCTTGNEEVEWCERGLLARIHRLTLARLRREIEPVTAAEYMRFLMEWQHVAPGSRLHGSEGLRRVITQLAGIELPAQTWERDVLPARIENYSPELLDQLCLSGEVCWGRLSSPVAKEEDSSETQQALQGTPSPQRGRRKAPSRAAPLAFAPREEFSELRAESPDIAELRRELSDAACEILDHLGHYGASFLTDIAKAVRRMNTEVEEAMWELVAAGLITGDGTAGLRALIASGTTASRGRRPHARGPLRGLPDRRSPRTARPAPAGRWSLLHRDVPVSQEDRDSGTDTDRTSQQTTTDGAQDSQDARDERTVIRLLERWGVVFREVCRREKHLPPWRRILWALRRLEARGDVRGGRFVSGYGGEQFALPRAVEALRELRRKSRGTGNQPDSEHRLSAPRAVTFPPGTMASGTVDSETVACGTVTRGTSSSRRGSLRSAAQTPGDVLLITAADPLNLLGTVLPGGRVSPYSNNVIAFRNGLPVETGPLGTVRSRLQNVPGKAPEGTAPKIAAPGSAGRRRSSGQDV